MPNNCQKGFISYKVHDPRSTKTEKKHNTGFTHLYFPEKQRLKILFSSLGDKIKKLFTDWKCNVTF